MLQQLHPVVHKSNHDTNLLHKLDVILMELKLSIDFPGISLLGQDYQHSKYNRSNLNQCIFLSEGKNKMVQARINTSSITRRTIQNLDRRLGFGQVLDESGLRKSVFWYPHFAFSSPNIFVYFAVQCRLPRAQRTRGTAKRPGLLAWPPPTNSAPPP